MWEMDGFQVGPCRHMHSNCTETLSMAHTNCMLGIQSTPRLTLTNHSLLSTYPFDPCCQTREMFTTFYSTKTEYRK